MSQQYCSAHFTATYLVAERVEIYSPTDGFDGRGASINTESKVDFDTNGWNTIFSGSATLTSITFYTGGQVDMAAFAVRVDGNLLVDPTTVRFGVLLGQSLTIYPKRLGIDKVFDGKFDTYWFAKENTTSRYTFPSIQSGSKFELFIHVSLLQLILV